MLVLFKNENLSKETCFFYFNKNLIIITASEINYCSCNQGCTGGENIIISIHLSLIPTFPTVYSLLDKSYIHNFSKASVRFFFMFLKEVSYVHEGSNYLIKNTLKTVIFLHHYS